MSNGTDENYKTIVVCFSRDRSLFSWFTYFTDGGGYTHASISFDEDSDHYYSINFHGLKREYITSLKRRPRKMVRYKIMVTNEQYEELKKIITAMESGKKFKYDRLGTLLCLMKLPNSADGEEKLFCSQFVAKVLDQSGCVSIKKAYGQLSPNKLKEELDHSGRVTGIEDDSTWEDLPEKAGEKIIEKCEEGEQTVDKLTAKNLEFMKNNNLDSPELVKIVFRTTKTGKVVFKAVESGTKKTAVFAGSITEIIAKKIEQGIKNISAVLGKFVGRR